MTLLPLLAVAPDMSDWEVWAPHTWAPWLSMRLFKAGLFFLGAFLLDHAWRALLRRIKVAALRRDPANEKELERRLDTIGGVARRIGSISLFVVAFLMTLADFGVQVGPLVAGLGIVGVAVGFGSQFLVRDLITGFFLIAEDQFRVGDSVKIADCSGTVETIAIRTVSVRALGGELHTVPNGEVRVVTNYSRHWSRAVVDVSVARGADLAAVFDALKEAGLRAKGADKAAKIFLEDPEVVGATDLADASVKVRIWAKVGPGLQWEAERDLRKAVSEVFTERRIPMPRPGREITLDGPSLQALRSDGEKP